mgnify:CR=1 FL=1
MQPHNKTVKKKIQSVHLYLLCNHSRMLIFFEVYLGYVILDR